MKKLAIAATIWLCCLSAHASPSFLHYSGDSYVAAGLIETVSSPEGFTFAPSVYNTRSSIQIEISNFAIEPDPNLWKYFSLWLTSFPGSELSIGTYTDVGIAPPEFPGLNFTANHRGIGFAYEGSSFRILDIAFGNNDEVSSLAVDFIQADYNGQLGRDGSTLGSLRYQSNIPLSIPEPTSYALVVLALALAGITRKGSLFESSADEVCRCGAA